MNFNIKNRIISYDKGELISYNNDYVANFTFDDEWIGLTKTARFYNNSSNEYTDIILVNDSCNIPLEILKFGEINVGVYSQNITTTKVAVQVDKSIKDGGGSQASPTPNIYEQLTGRLDDIEEEMPTQVATEVESYVTEHHNELKGDQGEAGKDGVSVVNVYLQDGDLYVEYSE